jgi:hypothetical protein
MISTMASGDSTELERLNTRRTSVLSVGGFRPTLDPAASNIGVAPLGLPGEVWPASDSKPLTFVCQLNLGAAPVVPERLKDLQLVTFFADLESAKLGRENGQNWVLRTYPSLEGLVRMTAPADAPKLRKGFECRWQEAEDHPNHDDPEIVLPPGDRRPGTQLENVVRTKVGGYASTIQCEPWWGYDRHPAQPRFCLQINSEEKPGLIWPGGGTVYLARGTAPGSEGMWFLDLQSF